jgi:hypothetical protein
MKARASMTVSASGDSSDGRSVSWLLPPVRLLPDGGPLVIGVAPPMRARMVRRWQRVAEERGVQQDRGQAA